MNRATQSTSENEINQLNLAMRQSPWYQEFFQVRGLDPNRVKLNERQRAELAQVAAQNDYRLGDRMKIDEAGNINQKGGFAGMPTWAKVAISAAPIAGAMLIPGAQGAVLGGLKSVGGSLGFGGGAQGASMASTATGSSWVPPGLTSGGLFGGTSTAAELASLPTLTSSAFGGSLATGPTSIISSLTGGGGGVGGTLKKLGGRFINNLLGRDDASKFGDASSMFGRFANDEANQRISNADINTRYNYDMLAAQRDRRDNEADAIKKLSTTAYIKSGGAPFDASKIQLSGGRSLPSFSFPRPPITDEMKRGASDLEAEMLKRLAPGGSFTPKPVDEFTRRGVGEQVGRWGSVGTGILGLAKDFLDR